MPQTATEKTPRVGFRISPDDKAVLMRAASIRKTDLTHFVLEKALSAAREIISEEERIQLSPRDSLRVLNLLEHPPKPNQRLLAAAFSLPRDT